MKSFYKAHIDNRNSLYSNKPNFSETFMKPSCQVHTQQVIQTQKLPLKINMVIITTQLKLKQNLCKIKTLWNQIQIQPEIHNKSHCKSKILFTLNYLPKKHEINLYNCNEEFAKFCH